MNQDLDSLTDEQLNEVFAVEVAGWVATTEEWRKEHFWGPDYAFIAPDKPYPVRRTEACAQFSTDANAVLPWLEKEPQISCDYGDPKMMGMKWWRVFDESRGLLSHAPTFPRAATIALIRAKRANHLDPSAKSNH